MNEQFVGGASGPSPASLTDDQRKQIARMLLQQGMNGNGNPGDLASGGMAYDQSGASVINGAAGLMGAYLMGQKPNKNIVKAGAPGIALLGNGALSDIG